MTGTIARHAAVVRCRKHLGHARSLDQVRLYERGRGERRDRVEWDGARLAGAHLRLLGAPGGAHEGKADAFTRRRRRAPRGSPMMRAGLGPFPPERAGKELLYHRRDQVEALGVGQGGIRPQREVEQADEGAVA